MGVNLKSLSISVLASCALLLLGTHPTYLDSQIKFMQIVSELLLPVKRDIENQKLYLKGIVDRTSLIQEIQELKQKNALLNRIASAPAGSSVVKVVSPSVTVTDGYLIIDRGIAANVDNGDLVAVGSYLLGVVEDVATNYSRVRLVTADKSSLAVSVNGNIALAIGYGNLAVRVTDLPSDVVVASGSRVKLIGTKQNPLLGSYELGVLTSKISGTADPTQLWEVNYPVVLGNLESVTLIKSK